MLENTGKHQVKVKNLNNEKFENNRKSVCTKTENFMHNLKGSCIIYL